MQTRAAENLPLITPDASQFKVQVLNPGNKILKKWEHYSQISNPIKIQTGTFTLKAFYGVSHTGAFDKPYFEGSSKFEVRRGQQTDVAVICYLANVMVTTSYTEKFKAFFKDYSVNICSSGEPVVFKPETTSAGFFEPGPLSVIVNVTKQDGTSFSFPAAQIDQTKAKEYYRFKFDLAGDPGNEKLQISFDASTIDSPITIDLSQSWIAGELPAYINTGFTNGQQFSNMEGEASPTEIATLITVPSRIKSCKITTTSDQLINAGWPAKEVDLTEVDSETKAKLKEFGLKWTERLKGLNMAQIDFTEIVPHLPGGTEDITHSFSVTTIDDWGQTSIQPLALSFITASPSFILLPHEDVWVKTTDMDFNLTLTKGKIEQIRLEYNDGKQEEWIPLTYTANPTSTINYKLETAINFTSPNAKIRAMYGSGKTSEIAFNVTNPTFRIEQIGLPWAKRISLNLTETNGDFLFRNFNTLKNEIQLKINGEKKEDLTFEITKNSDNTVRFDINGLEDNTQQQIEIGYNGGIGESTSNVIEFMTEEFLQIPGSDFDTWELPKALFMENVQKGGRPGKGLWGGLQDAVFVNVSTYQPQFPWTSVNKKTVPTSVKTKNTWYIIPSTYYDPNGHSGKAAVLRNVGWDNYGSAVPDGKSGFSAQTLADLTPPTIGQFSAGKLFLGTYDCTHNSNTSGLINETYNYGYSFVSRPIGIKFYYKYTANGNDSGLIRGCLKATNGTIIATIEESLTPQNNYIEHTVKFVYSNTNLKAASISILFASSDKCSKDQSIENSQIKTVDRKVEAISVGSELYIDDIELVY